jgi:hypothetical protein
MPARMSTKGIELFRTAFLNVHNLLRGVALREDGFFSSELGYRAYRHSIDSLKPNSNKS